MAFETFNHNFLDPGEVGGFQWPDWLPPEAMDVEILLRDYRVQLARLKGTVHLLAGGPPCQGFSLAGRRKTADQRNQLFQSYLELVGFLQPMFLVIENVAGFANDFHRTEKGLKGKKISGDLYNAHKALVTSLDKLDYECYTKFTLMAKDYGVPQLRPRYINVAVHRDYLLTNPLEYLENHARKALLQNYGLDTEQPISVADAISDLLMAHGTITVPFPRSQSFKMGLYGHIESHYQQVMRTKLGGDLFQQGDNVDSHRFPNHREKTLWRFQDILDRHEKGRQLRREQIREYNLNKHRIAPIAPDKPCNTLTSLPDDLIHYQEPRVPTVREYARLQSFPDYFAIKSEYTTGSYRRKYKIPRYTQVANAVPPFLAQAIGMTFLDHLQAVGVGLVSAAGSV